jgi:2-polyprenyl-3-methyl-5-hydroxy-6-metoxy-1,4-benzoquinol methylase
MTETEQFFDKKLSPQEYWDKVLKDASLPRCNAQYIYIYGVTMDFIDQSIRQGNYKTFIEIGCGSSGWLPYFAKQYGLTVSGLDYSEIGCKLAEKNLQMQNIKYDEIICKDLFSPNCTDGKKYDIVFSYGVVEHFECPEEVLEIFNSLVNPSGICITLVPNINGINGLLCKYFVRPIYAMHHVFTKQSLQKCCIASDGMQLLKTGYVGNFTFAVLPLVRTEKLRNFPSLRFIFRKALYAIDKILTMFYRTVKITMPSKMYSPYIICITKAKQDK